MIKIKRALISVFDKQGLTEFAACLRDFGVEIISTGGTAAMLREKGFKVKEVSEHTGFPEMLDGRVKTLHPAIHGGLLAVRSNREHMESLKNRGIEEIDMVVVNLYPFEAVASRPGAGDEEIVENIDIGGPSMLRSAAKNSASVAVICDPRRYPAVISEMKRNNGCLPVELLRSLAAEAFARTSAYDGAIYAYLSGGGRREERLHGLPRDLRMEFVKLQDLRYGENPHQRAAFYGTSGRISGLAAMRQLQGKELSFNNFLDLNAAVEIAREFNKPSAVIVKHNNPCGAACAQTLCKAYLDAWKCDQLSAFGGIVALNKPLDAKTASAILRSGFLECVIAPGYDKGVAELFKGRKNLRLLELPDYNDLRGMDFKRVNGGCLLQERDIFSLDEQKLKVVTRKKPGRAQMKSLFFAWEIAKHVKSNAIVLAKGTRCVGIGAGQMSRGESVAIAAKKAGRKAGGLCLASDAFFPKPDSITLASRAGVKAIIQPGGSIADEEIIRACDKYGIAMVFTGIRHFKH